LPETDHFSCRAKFFSCGEEVPGVSNVKAAIAASGKDSHTYSSKGTCRKSLPDDLLEKMIVAVSTTGPNAGAVSTNRNHLTHFAARTKHRPVFCISTPGSPSAVHSGTVRSSCRRTTNATCAAAASERHVGVSTSCAASRAVRPPQSLARPPPRQSSQSLRTIVAPLTPTRSTGAAGLMDLYGLIRRAPKRYTKSTMKFLFGQKHKPGSGIWSRLYALNMPPPAVWLFEVSSKTERQDPASDPPSSA